MTRTPPLSNRLFPVPAPVVWRCLILGVAVTALARSLDAPPGLSVLMVPATDSRTTAQADLSPLRRATIDDAALGAEILARPIFQMSRRPWIPPPPPPPPAVLAAPAPMTPLPPPPTQWSLTGTVLQQGNPYAVLRSHAVPKALVLHEGALLEGWTLRSIRHSGLIFERDDQTWTLGFRKTP
jgi:hypothetical protein